MRDLLKRFRRLSVEWLPPYSPNLDPVEPVWAWLKRGKMANFVPGSLADIDERARAHLEEARADPALLKKLWEGSELPYPPDFLNVQVNRLSATRSASSK